MRLCEVVSGLIQGKVIQRKHKGEPVGVFRQWKLRKGVLFATYSDIVCWQKREKLFSPDIEATDWEVVT